MQSNAFDLRFSSALANFMELPDVIAFDVEFTLNHPDVRKLLYSNETFDVVIAEIFQADALFGE